MGQAKPLILVVEDDELLRLHAADLLEEHGFGVVEAENADAALKLLETRDDVRLLFTDIQMPGSCDGMDLARKVHARWPRILLIITSGQIKPAQAEIPDHGRFVSKPYRAKRLDRGNERYASRRLVCGSDRGTKIFDSRLPPQSPRGGRQDA
jgi:two-component system, response regulator PdtaR